MKKILFTTALMLIISFPIMMNSVQASELSTQEIAKRFDEINSKYSVGEILNKEDENFIKTYAKKGSDSKSASNEHIIKPFKAFYGTGKNGSTKASILGQYTLQQGTLNQAHQVSMTTAMDSGKADKITNQHTHTAFGTFGSGGIGKVYTKTEGRSCNATQSCYSYFSEKYTAHALYYTQLIKSTIYHNGNKSFDIIVSGI